MEIIKNKLRSVKHGLKDIHTKKPYLELIAAALTIPVLITVFALNVDNLKGNKDAKVEDNSKTQTIVITQPANDSKTEPKEKEVVVTKEACEPGIGDISIATPSENETVTDNPVLVDIDYEQGKYCEVVWSYKVNAGAWSSYDDTSISLYNLSDGNVKLELRVKSVVNSDQKTLTRNFTYSGAASTPTVSPSLTPTPTQ